jgi:hypothetical protein
LVSPGAVCGVDQLPDLLGTRRIGGKTVITASEVVRAGDNRRGGTIQFPGRPERVLDDLLAAIRPAGENAGARHP